MTVARTKALDGRALDDKFLGAGVAGQSAAGGLGSRVPSQFSRPPAASEKVDHLTQGERARQAKSRAVRT